jgi:hypothetical protein
MTTQSNLLVVGREALLAYAMIKSLEEKIIDPAKIVFRDATNDNGKGFTTEIPSVGKVSTKAGSPPSTKTELKVVESNLSVAERDDLIRRGILTVEKKTSNGRAPSVEFSLNV